MKAKRGIWGYGLIFIHLGYLTKEIHPMVNSHGVSHPDLPQLPLDVTHRTSSVDSL